MVLALPHFLQRGWLHSWCKAGKPLPEGGQGLWQPPAGWRRFPRALPLCLQGSTEKKLGDSQEQLAELSSAWAVSKTTSNPVDPDPGQPLIPTGGATEEPAGTAEPSVGVSTTLWRPHSATGTVPSMLICGLTKCPPLPSGRGHRPEW